MQLREAVLELQEENQESKKEIGKLRKKLEVSKKLNFDGSVYRMEGKEKEGPFCQRCYDVDQNLVRLQVNPLGHGLSEWYCKAFEKSFEMK